MSFRRMRHVKAREFQGCDIAYDFSNPASLYDATAGGSLVAADGAIARAEDLSGNAGHMLQTTSGYRPLRKVAALNGMDVARFDGSNDYLDAGDVGDMLDKPVEAYVLFKRTGGKVFQGFFGKARYGAVGGWGIYRYTSDAGFLSVASGGSEAVSATVLSPQLLALVSQRKTGASAGVTMLRRNAGQTVASGSSYTDPLDSIDTTDVTLLGAYQNNTGTTPPKANTYFTGDMGECAKYSVAFSDAQRQRRDCGLARKWRIAT